MKIIVVDFWREPCCIKKAATLRHLDLELLVRCERLKKSSCPSRQWLLCKPGPECKIRASTVAG